MIIVTTPPEQLKGELSVPGDKSVTHRAIMLGAISRGQTEVRGYLDAADCRSTVSCLRALGVKITYRMGRLLIEGRGLYLSEPGTILDAGNSGTTARLLLGILAGQPFMSTLTGDDSLRSRPMKRVTEPLAMMGAHFEGPAERLPLTVRGGRLKAVSYRSPRASAQVKSAVLLAGLYAEGLTDYEEPYLSRNHTELMLAYFGAGVRSVGNRVYLRKSAPLRGKPVRVPGDISAAAFLMVAAALVPGSAVLLRSVGVNPTRSGIVDALRAMGADISLRQRRQWGREPVADILVRGGPALEGITVEGALVPRLIDEIPVLAAAAALARGRTVIRDAAELRVKEADRISALAAQLTKLGAAVTEQKDGMVIDGVPRLTGAEVNSCGDHRIAMALAVAGLAASGETAVHDAGVVDISYPRFMADLRSLAVK